MPDGGTCGWTNLDAGNSGGCAAGSPGPVGAAPATLVLDGGLTIYGNVTYATRGGRVLQGDLFVPPSGSVKPGLLVLVHGGGWLSCDQRRGVISPFALFFADTFKVAVFNIEYRLLQEGGAYPENLGDVKCATQFIASKGALYGFDPARMAIMGESAGAHLSLMTALTEDRADLDPGCGTAPKLKGVFAYSPPTDLPLLTASNSPAKGAPPIYTSSTCTAQVAPCTRSCDRCLDASPRSHVCSAKAPILIVHAPDPYDGLLSQNQSTALQASLRDAGADSTLLIPDASVIAMQTWNGNPCTADAGIAHGFQTQCLLVPTLNELSAAVHKALDP